MHFVTYTNACITRYVHATDTDFAKFRCPVFKGLVITVSGLSPDERKQVKQYVESEGKCLGDCYKK